MLSFLNFTKSIIRSEVLAIIEENDHGEKKKSPMFLKIVTKEYKSNEGKYKRTK